MSFAFPPMSVRQGRVIFGTAAGARARISGAGRVLLFLSRRLNGDSGWATCDRNVQKRGWFRRNERFGLLATVEAHSSISPLAHALTEAFGMGR